jgi:hypothetical protein
MTYTIVYNGTPIRVNPTHFAEASEVFAQYYDPKASGEELSITSQVPLPIFQEFLPAVQRGSCTITEENISTLRGLADEWKVETLREECDRWEKSATVVLHRLRSAIQSNDRGAVAELIPKLADQIDLALDSPEFVALPAKVIGDILGQSNCNVTEHEKLLRALKTVLQNGGKVSGLLNHVSVDSLNPDTIEAVITCDRLDLNAAGDFISNCAQRFIQNGKQSREKIQRLENQIRKSRKQCDDITASIRSVQHSLDEQRQRHQEHQRELQIARQAYEPDPPPGSSADHGAGQGRKKVGGKPKNQKSQFVYYPEPDPPAKPEPPAPKAYPPPAPAPAPQHTRPRRNDQFSWSPDE